MDFDDGRWIYRGAISVKGGRGAYFSPWAFKRKTIAVEVAVTAKKSTWYRSGYVRYESNGLNIPNSEPLSFGRTVLTAPNFPEDQSYRIQFTPVAWLPAARLRFWEFQPTRKAARLNPIDPDEFTTQEVELIHASGLDPEKLRLSPESLEIVLPLLMALRSPQSGSILTDIKTLIQELTNMSSTDIRNLATGIQALESQTSQLQNDVSVAQSMSSSQAYILEDLTANSVIEKNFTLEKTAFVLNGSVYQAPINHIMGTLTPGVSIYDNDGDLQLLQFIAVDSDNSKLELNAAQYADNSFPLKVNLQAKPKSLVAAGTWHLIPNGDRYFRLLNGFIDRSSDAVNVENPALASDAIEAFLSNAGQYVFFKKSDNSYGFIENGNLGGGVTVTTEANYLDWKGRTGSVAL